MKNKILLGIVALVAMLGFPGLSLAQVTLGTEASKYVLFTSSGLIDDNPSALSHVTGNLGTNTPGSITDFGNIDGVKHPGADLSTALVDVQLLATIAQIDALPATLVGPLTLGSGGSITPGVWQIPGNATITLDLNIDALGDPTAQFIIKVEGTLGMNTLSRVKLVNGALACNIFWKVDLAVNMASLATMRGNLISGGAITMGSGDSLEGRAFSTPAGAIVIDQLTAFTPIGCNSPQLTGPNEPDLGSLICYTIFTTDGALVGNLSSTSIGDVGNAGGGTVTGWTAGNVVGTLHATGDPSTMLAATDLLTLYDTLAAMNFDIQLEFPVLLGSNLVLTPHVYLIDASLNGPAFLTDTIILNAQDNPDAVFVFQIINGAFSTTVGSKVKLINGAQAKNVFWMVDGAVSINSFSVFAGTIVISSGELNLVSASVVLEGRAFTKVGLINTAGLTATMTPGCGGANIITDPADVTACPGSPVTFSVVATSAISYQWFEDSGSGFVPLTNTPPYSNVDSATLTINPVTLAMNNNKYRVAVAGVSETTTSNFATLSVVTSILITSTTPNSVCGPDTVVLSATANTGTLSWFANLTGGLALDTGITFTTPLLSVTDTFYVESTSGSCTTSPRQMVIATVNPVATITSTSPNSICGPGTVTLGAASSGGVINWYANLTGGASLDTGVTYTTPLLLATDTFYVSAILGSCSSTPRTMVIASVNQTPTITGTTPNSVCGTGSAIIGATASAGTLNWYANSTGGASLGTGNSFTTPVISVQDTFYVDATVAACPVSPRSMVIVPVNALPIVTASASSTTICAGESVTLTGGGAVTYTWSGGATNGTAFAPATTTPFTVTGTDANNCTNTATVTVNVNQTAAPIANSNSPLCTGGTINLQAATVVGGTYAWTGPNGFSSTDQNPTINSATPSNEGIYTVIITVNGCASSPATLPILLNICAVDLSVVKTADNMSPMIGDKIIFTIVATNNGPETTGGVIVTEILQSGYNFEASTATTGSYDQATALWTIGTMISGASETLVITATVNPIGSYVNTATILGSDEDPNLDNNVSTITPVPNDFFIPEGFSPNADGINDPFVIRGLVNYPDNSITIFNRWGDKVYEAAPYTNSWDGKASMGITIGSDELPISTYYYLFSKGDGSPMIKGTIYLNR